MLYVFGHTCVVVLVWKSEDTFLGVDSLLLCGSRELNSVVRLSGKCLYLPSYWPRNSLKLLNRVVVIYHRMRKYQIKMDVKILGLAREIV